MLELAFLTAAIETPLFFLFSFRKSGELILFAGVNIISNVLLNDFLESIDFDWEILILGEIFVVILEFSLCTYFIEPSRKLFRTIFLTNLASFLIGLMIVA